MWVSATTHMFYIHDPNNPIPCANCLTWSCWQQIFEIIIIGLNIFIPWIGDIDVYLFIPEIKLSCVLLIIFLKNVPTNSRLPYSFYCHIKQCWHKGTRLHGQASSTYFILSWYPASPVILQLPVGDFAWELCLAGSSNSKGKSFVIISCISVI